jgi:peptidyl-prolyl cis-trans isomerase C
MISKLDGGADFAELAGKNSTGPSAPDGGDLGWFSPKQMVKPFSDAVAKLKKDEYTKTPVKTEFGYHVIMRTGSRETDAPAFNDLKEQLRMRLQNKLVELYISELRKGADIKRQ